MKRRSKKLLTFNLVFPINHVNQVYPCIIFKSVIPMLFLFAIFWIIKTPHINALDDSIDSTQCLIGRLQMCNDDEDCVERETLNRQISPLAQRSGDCVCRDLANCKRKTFLQPKSDQLSISDVHSDLNSNLRIFIGLLSGLSFLAFCCFLVYYYGIRYGMLRHFARRFGLTIGNTQIEDNELLNQIVTNRDEDVELNIR